MTRRERKHGKIEVNNYSHSGINARLNEPYEGNTLGVTHHDKELAARYRYLALGNALILL